MVGVGRLYAHELQQGVPDRRWLQIYIMSTTLCFGKTEAGKYVLVDPKNSAENKHIKSLL